MSIFFRKSILKSGVLFMLVALVVGIFAMHSPRAFAMHKADCGGDVSTTCDVGVVGAGPLVAGLAFNSYATVNLLGTTGNVSLFDFKVNVTDTRGTKDGWRLQASSAGLTDGFGHTISIQLADTTTTPIPTAPACTPTGVTGTDCPTPVVATSPVTLSASATTFVTETASADNNISGTAILDLHGTYDTTSAAPGHYTGKITLSLASSSS